jgi:hypothetical protein
VEGAGDARCSGLYHAPWYPGVGVWRSAGIGSDATDSFKQERPDAAFRPWKPQ